MIYDSLVEKIMQHFSSGDYTPEVIQAKKEFFERAGVFDESSEDFEVKAAQFMDWYVFTRPLSQGQEPPVVKVAEGREYEIPNEEFAFYTNLRHHRHSLFEFIKSKGSEIHIKDLFSGYKHIVAESSVTEGFDRYAFFEARIIPHEDHFVFARAFCFHPPEVNKFILKEVKGVKKMAEADQPEGRQKLIARLFKMRYKYDQYRHVDVSEIYSNNSKLRL